MKNRIGLIIVAAVALLGARNAQGYDFKVGHMARNTAPVTYAHLNVVSAFCHDRSPVDVADGDAPLTFGNYVSGTTAPGCLIRSVVMMQGSTGYPNTERTYVLPWAGGTFTMMWAATRDLYICPEDTSCTW